MKLSDVQKRLQAPFPAHVVAWKPGVITKDRKRALMLAHIDARAVQDRLDAICPDGWNFEVEVVAGTRLPTVKGRLTVLGVTREDIGEAPEGDLGTLKAASSDALKRCAVHFGIGRYLYDLPKQWADWDDAKRQPTSTPELPDWARPDHERSPGGAHLVQAMEQLRYELPEDLELQREVYKHLKAALSSLHPESGLSGQGRAA
ncbi:single-stranded DNA-binding protein DdrA [Deinococcus koreensis]|uniref:Single-stranded DNA-binding protein n=1 Tax=Deinococcus koreensis TaxID=2054903 RepID=A0A2K3V181_9DEIO|nr:single-stranded DNA-binding protein DdrA [Deinococcus koreensis]PNY82537.1 single-stranded DNA-binding protein [Deinococcus koreensis]